MLTPAGEAVARIGNHHVRVHEWADLARPAEPPVGDQTAAEVGRLLGVLHGLALPATGPDDPWYAEVRPPTDWAALADHAAFGPGMFATAIVAPLNFLFVMAEQAIADPSHRDYCERQLSGLLQHDLDDLARFLDLAEDLLPASYRSAGS